jgi:hypothetical protein
VSDKKSDGRKQSGRRKLHWAELFFKQLGLIANYLHVREKDVSFHHIILFQIRALA